MVFGATGGTGKHFLREISQRRETFQNIRCLVRNKEDAIAKLSEMVEDIDSIELFQGSVSNAEDIANVINGADYVVILSAAKPKGFRGLELMGLTSPSAGHPKFDDLEAIKNICLASNASGTVKHIILCSSQFVTRPFTVVALILNSIVSMILSYKLEAEMHLRASGLPFTIVRPPGLTNRDHDSPIGFCQNDSYRGGKMLSRRLLAKTMVKMIADPDTIGTNIDVYEDPEGGKWISDLSFSRLQKDSLDLNKKYQNTPFQHHLATRAFVLLFWGSIAATTFFVSRRLFR